MSKKVGFKLNLQGLNELMKSKEMQNALEEAGATVAKMADDGKAVFGHSTHLANYVAICNVYPDSREAAKKNYKENTLLKALGAVGLPTSKKG